MIKLRDASEFDHEAPVVNQMRYAGVEEKGEQQTNKAVRLFYMLKIGFHLFFVYPALWVDCLLKI